MTTISFIVIIDFVHYTLFSQNFLLQVREYYLKVVGGKNMTGIKRMAIRHRKINTYESKKKSYLHHAAIWMITTMQLN